MGQTVTRNFTAAGAGDGFSVPPGESITYSVSGTYTGVMVFERSGNGGQTWEPIRSASGQAFGGTVANETRSDLRYRWRSEVATGTASTEIADADDIVQRFTNRQGEDRIVITDDGVQFRGTLTVVSD